MSESSKRTMESAVRHRSSKRRRRRGACGSDGNGRNDPLASLALDWIACGKRVVFITGAGVSVASGVPTFRGNDDAVWSTFLYEWGTREKFEKNPPEWYATFWRAYFDDAIMKGYAPNPAHCALAEICALCPDTVRVITQNVDRLHSTGEAAIPRRALIEIHGRTGAYKCFTEDCVYESKREHIVALPFSKTSNDDENNEFIRCPECSAVMCPNCLLFDEDYESHDTYRFDEAVDEWIENADAIVFVGTSFAVGITSIALERASSRQPSPAAVFNINPAHCVPRGKATKAIVEEVRENAEVALPRLAHLVKGNAP